MGIDDQLKDEKLQYDIQNTLIFKMAPGNFINID